MAALTLLEAWCKGKDLDPRKALLIVGIPAECSKDEITEILKANLQPLGSYKIQGRMTRREDKAKAVFIKLDDSFNVAKIPSQIAGKGGTWEVVMKPRKSDDEFSTELGYFWRNESPRMVDVAKILGHSSVSDDVQPEGFSQRNPTFLQPQQESTWYREFKVFSGNTLPKQGEENLDVWLQQVTEIWKLWQMSEEEKRRHLLESLRDSAASIVRMLRAHSDTVTADQCLNAVKQIFGSRQDYRTSQFHFLHSFQQVGEKVSVFVFRLEVLMQKAVRQTPMPNRTIDTIRLNYVLARATMTTHLRGKLKLLDKRGHPPTFLELMKLIRDDEDWETTLSVMKEKERKEERSFGASGRQVVAEATVAIPQVPVQARPRGHKNTQTMQVGTGPPLKYRRQDGPGTGEEGHSRATGTQVENQHPAKSPQLPRRESGNEAGPGIMSHPKP